VDCTTDSGLGPASHELYLVNKLTRPPIKSVRDVLVLFGQIRGGVGMRSNPRSNNQLNRSEKGVSGSGC